MTANMEENFEAALDSLLNVEKQMRLAGDVAGTKKAVIDILELCYEARAWETLNDQIVLLSKRRGQLKQVVTAMVQTGMQYIALTPDIDTCTELIQTLNNVSAGKMYVEIERSRLIKLLARIKEEKGLIADAADLMQEIDVETFGAMAKTEKLSFILEQVRLCLDLQDYVRAQVLLRKISPRMFRADALMGMESSVVEDAPADIPSLLVLERKYYGLMIRYHSHNNDYLEICRSYMQIYNILYMNQDPTEWIPALRKVCWFLVLSPHDPMQSSLLNYILWDKNLHELPYLHYLLYQLATMNIIPLATLWATYTYEFEIEIHFPGGALGSRAEEDLKLRIIENNIRVVSNYYSRMTLNRLSDILCLSLQETEKHLSDMVTSKALVAKIDRPMGIVCFQKNMDSNGVLNEWAMYLENLLNLVEMSCDQIDKETMVHKAALEV